MTMPTLPAMPSMSNGRYKPTRPCACGCGAPTKSMWYPGHDGRATGWSIRIERGLMSIGDVPANERAGAAIMLRRHGHADLAEMPVPADPTPATTPDATDPTPTE